MSTHYILDGYNVLHQTEVFSGGKLESAREALIQCVESDRPQGSLKNKVTVVFDGQAGIWSRQERSLTEVLFSVDESADALIKRLVEKSTSRKSITVVTDDRDIQFFVRSLGAKVVGVATFLAKTRFARKPTKLTQNPKGKDSGRKELPKAVEAQITDEMKAMWLKKKKDS